MTDKFIDVVRRLGCIRRGWREDCPTEAHWYFQKRSKFRRYLVIVNWSARSTRIERLR
jgi:hypothetical protein